MKNNVAKKINDLFTKTAEEDFQPRRMLEVL